MTIRLYGLRMAVHSGQAPIVLCPDILVEIFNHLEPGRRRLHENKVARRKRHVCQQSLLACSLTCRTLSDLALDVLWRALNDVQPLLRILDGDKRKQSLIVLQSPISPEAWTKFQRYATRVREIGHSSRPDRVHPSVWTFLSIQCRGSPLLPRLYALEAHKISSDDLSSLFLFLSPSVRSLCLSFKQGSWTSPDHGALLTLQGITQVAPRVSSLRLFGSHNLTSQHTSVLENCSTLTDLYLGPRLRLDAPALLRLSASISLNALTISVHNIEATDLQTLTLNNGFQFLHKLTVRGSLNELVGFIAASSLPSLHELVLKVIDSNPVTQMQLCNGLESICEHLSRNPTSFKRVGCDFCSGIAERVGRTGSLARYLKPFLRFSLIESCHLNFDHTLPPICDRDLAELGNMWGNLQSLEVTHMRYVLDDRAHSADGRHPTLLGLIELARRCPRLVHVHLPDLDARTLPKTSGISFLGRSIREVSFDNVHYASTHAKRPCAVAAVLDTVFPLLDVANSMSACVSPSASVPDLLRDGMNQGHSKWWKVMKIVRAMQLGRRRRDLADFGAATSGSDYPVSTSAPENFDGELDLDMDSIDWEPEEGSHQGLCLSPECEGDSDFSESDPQQGLQAAIFRDAFSELHW